MTPKKTLQAFDDIIGLLTRTNALVKPRRIDLIERFNSMQDDAGYFADCHLLYMCEEGKKFVQEAETLQTEDGFLPVGAQRTYMGKMEKAMRWLGFVQGVLWRSGAKSVEQLKDMNRE